MSPSPSVQPITNNKPYNNIPPSLSDIYKNAGVTVRGKLDPST